MNPADFVKLEKENPKWPGHLTKSPSSWASWAASWTSLAQSKPSAEERFACGLLFPSQAAQAQHVWVRASKVIWSEYARIISVLSDAK